MTYRKPSVGIASPGSALKAIEGREHQLNQFPFLAGRWIELEFKALAQTARANHGLGRAYVGAMAPIVATNTGAGDMLEFQVMAPELAKTLGYDVTREIAVKRDGSGTPAAVTVRVWVF